MINNLMEVEYMFIVENANSIITERFNNFPEITDWSDDSYNILEASLFFNEDLNKIVQATAVAEVIAYHEGTIESFNEGAFETVKNKLAELWRKFKAFVLKVRDRFMAWIRKTFTSNESFWAKYGNVIEDNYSKLVRKNPSFKFINKEDVGAAFGRYNALVTKFSSDGADSGFNNIDIKNEENKSQVVDAYNDYMEQLDDIKKDMREALTKEEEFKLSELTSVDCFPLKKDTYKKIVESFKKGKDNKGGTDSLEKDIKAEERNISTWSKSKNRTDLDKTLGEGHSVDTAKALYAAKLKKELWTFKLNSIVELSKKTCKLATKVAYEAVKLQNTKEEDIKEESASLDLLNKYLQRI